MHFGMNFRIGVAAACLLLLSPWCSDAKAFVFCEFTIETSTGYDGCVGDPISATVIVGDCQPDCWVCTMPDSLSGDAPRGSSIIDSTVMGTTCKAGCCDTFAISLCATGHDARGTSGDVYHSEWSLAPTVPPDGTISPGHVKCFQYDPWLLLHGDWAGGAWWHVELEYGQNDWRPALDQVPYDMDDPAWPHFRVPLWLIPYGHWKFRPCSCFAFEGETTHCWQNEYEFWRVRVDLSIGGVDDEDETDPGLQMTGPGTTTLSADLEAGWTAADLTAKLTWSEDRDKLRVYYQGEEVRSPYSWPANMDRTFRVDVLAPVQSTFRLDLDDLGCHDTVRLKMECPCSDCAYPDTDADLDSLDYKIRLGTANYGESAGYIYLHADRPSPGLATQDVLRSTNPTIDSELAYVPYSVTIPGQGTIYFTYVDSYKYQMDLKDTQDNLLKTIVVENPAASSTDYDTLKITESGQGDGMVYTYVWDEATTTWTLTKESGTSDLYATIALAEAALSATERTETRTVTNPDSTLASKVVRKYVEYPWGEELVEETHGWSTVQLTSRWDYYDNAVSDGQNYSHLKSYIDGQGRWEHYTYSFTMAADGRLAEKLITKVSQFGSNGYNPTDVVNNVKTDTYTFLLLDQNADQVPDLIDLDGDLKGDAIYKTVVTAPGSPQEIRYDVRCTGTVGNPVAGCYDELRVVCSADLSPMITSLQGLLANPLGSTHLVTKTRTYGNSSGGRSYRPLWVLEPTGMMTRYVYTLPSPNLPPSEVQWTYGTPDAQLTTILDGEQTTRVMDLAGNITREEVKRVEGGTPAFTVSLATSQRVTTPWLPKTWQTSVYLGDYNDPGQLRLAYTTSRTYGCCGLASETDRAGRTTSYSYDGLGRLTSTTEPTGIITRLTLDAEGRVLKNERVAPGLVITTAVNTYDPIGRLRSHKDELGQFALYTYKAIDGSGAPATGGAYTEQRVYPTDNQSGPIQVNWLDPRGQVVRHWTASTGDTWPLPTPQQPDAGPTGGETLSERGRTTSSYDWAGRVLSRWRYFELTGLGLSGAGQKDVNYYEETTTYNALGQATRSVDEIGNVTETVYESGREKDRYKGVGTTLQKVAELSYDANHGQGTVALRDYATMVKRLRPISQLSGAASDFTYTKYEQSYFGNPLAQDGNERVVWAMPATDTDPLATSAPWSRTVYDYDGHLIEQTLYRNGGSQDPEDLPATDILAKTESIYNLTTGHLTATRQYKVNPSGGLAGGYVETSYAYDTLGRQIQVKRPDGGAIKTKYDDRGRVERVVTAASVGADPSSFAQDLVVEEVVYTYDDLDRVIVTTTHERLHTVDASVLGLLSGPAGVARTTYKATWYDEFGRVEYQVDYGTYGGQSFTRPGTAPEPTGATDKIVTKHVYDDQNLGRWQHVLDNEGKVTRTEYDTFGRRTKVVENYVDGTPSDDTDRITTYKYIATGAVKEQAAILSTSAQTTTYNYGVAAPVPDNGLLGQIIYPDADGVTFTYHANGSVASRTDQRAITIASKYDDAGRLWEQSVTGTVEGATKVTRTYTDVGRLESIATFEGGTAVTSRIDYAYNGFGQLSEEFLDLDGAGTLAAKRVTYGYGNGTDYSPLTSVDYPYVGQTPARTIHYVYGATSNYFTGRGPISSAFSQIAEIWDGSIPLASYAYTGMNRPVARWHDGSGTSMTYEYDDLGRVTQLRHATFASLPTDSGGTDLAGSTYGYDSVGNRLYDKPLVMPAHGQAYQYDGLNRLTKADRGVLDAATHQVVAPYASPRTVDPKYDLLGNFLEDKVNSHVEARTHNLANEITLRSVSEDHGGVAAPGPAVYLDEPFTGTGWLGHWDPAGNFAEGSGVATSGSPASDNGVPWTPAGKDMMLVEGLTRLTSVTLSAKIAFPEGGDRYGGLVFGYQDADHYWVCVLKCAAGGGDTVAIYQVDGGTWTAVAGPTAVTGVEPGSGNAVTLGVLVQGRYVAVSLEGVQVDSASDVDVPPGRLGVLASHEGVAFDDVQVRRIDWPAPGAPTWSVLSGEFSFSGLGGAGISLQASDPLPLSVRETTYDGNYDIEAWLDGDEAGLALRVKDKLHYTFVTQSFAGSGLYWVYVWQVRDGQLQTPAAWGFVPMADSTTSKHVHVKAANGDVGVWLEDGGTWKCVVDPSTNGQAALAWPDAGVVGLVAGWLGATDCYLVGVGHDADNSHTLSMASEAGVYDQFPVNWVPAYDAAGNLTNDRVYKYAYDAWNRLVRVTRQGPAASPQVVAEYRYDGLGHRIQKTVTNSGDRNRTEYYYYNSKWQLLEIDNADGVARQQFVWGTNYIDEAVCMDVDADGDGDLTDFTDTQTNPNGGARRFFYMQDANWNVTGLCEGSHVVERYEYDPYGTVRIYKGYSAAAGHELLSVTSDSLKWLDSSLPGNPFLYAGYFQDSETQKYYVRHRMLGLDRWMQRDPKEYKDGGNTYIYVRSNPPNRLDPKGLATICTDPDPDVCGEEGEGCCEDELVFKGHGLFATCKCGHCNKWSIKFSDCIPDGMTNGISDSAPMLTPADVAQACGGLCEGATLTLTACGIGKNESEMKKLGEACPKIKRVCGYTSACCYIGETTFPFPWDWKCIDVNGGPGPKE